MVKEEHVKTDWLCCPKCGGKTRTQIRQHTVLEDFPLFCPKCKYACVVRYRNRILEAIRKTGLHCVFLFARRTAGISEHYEKQWRNPL